MRNILAAGGAVLAIGFAGVAAASTPCAVTYQHPAKAKLIKTTLIQAFVSCNNPGGHTPNATTETGTVPTCFPAVTYNQNAFSPSLGWTWGPKGRGDLTFTAGKNKVVHPLNTDPDAVDFSITVKMSDIRENGGAPASLTSGHLFMVTRMTIIDRVDDQLMTIIDFPTGKGLPVLEGKINVKTSYNVILNNLTLPALPRCSNIEFITVSVFDPNGNIFAAAGAFAP